MPTKSTETKPKKVTKKVAAKPKKKVTKAVDSIKKVRATKKTVTLKISRVLEPEEYFWLVEGGGLDSLTALADALDNMSGEQFAYHTQRDGNDFARWIGGTFLDEALARIIARQKTQEKCAAALRKYLAE